MKAPELLCVICGEDDGSKISSDKQKGSILLENYVKCLDQHFQESNFGGNEYMICDNCSDSLISVINDFKQMEGLKKEATELEKTYHGKLGELKTVGQRAVVLGLDQIAESMNDRIKHSKVQNENWLLNLTEKAAERIWDETESLEEQQSFLIRSYRKRIVEKCKIMQSGQHLDMESGIHEAVFDNGARSSEDVDFSSHRMQMLNRTESSDANAEEEPSADAGLHSAASSEPRRSLRRRKQEALLEKKSPSAISSGQKSKKNVVPSTSKCQETQSRGKGNSLKSSSMRGSKYLKKNGLTGLFQCRKCDKQSPCKTTINHHYESSHLKIRHQCDICNVAVSARRDHLARHRKNCQQKKRLARKKDPKSKDSVLSTSKCQEIQTCEGNSLKSSSPSRNNLQSKYFTKNPITGLLQCRKCDKQSSRRDDIRLHFQSVHEKIKHRCDICKVAVFSYARGLASHRLTCQQNREKRQAKEKDPQLKYLCEVCGTRFDSQKSLSQHRQKVHENVGRFPCDLCDKEFKTKPKLNAHKDGVHLGKKFSCKFCKKLFGFKSSVFSHEKSCPQKETFKAGDLAEHA